MTSLDQEKVGRNDPCPCGSGKKYKRCCLLKAVISKDRLWARQREASDELTRKLMRFARLNFEKSIEDAWQDFNMTDAAFVPVEPATEDQIFMPYFLFHWDPPARARKGSGNGIEGVVASLYKIAMADRLSEMDRMFLDQAATQPVSFHEVLESAPGEGLTIRDILIGTEIHVMEQSGSKVLQPGDIAYAQVWNLTGLAILGCCAPLAIPPRRKADVIALRAKLRRRIARQKRELDAKDLLKYADDIRETYLDIRDSLYAPPLFANTDGDPLAFHTLKFRVESADLAFDALAPLALFQSKEDLLESAELNDAGKLQRVIFEWMKRGNKKHSTWDNTILGTITISEHSVVAEVNSERRALRIRKEIEKRLGPGATYKSTIVHTQEEMLRDSSAEDKRKQKSLQESETELLRNPEVRKHLEEHTQKQLDGWINEKLPILGGRTPLEAVKNPDGKEIVEALLLQWERDVEKGNSHWGVRPNLQGLREKLYLPSRPTS